MFFIERVLDDLDPTKIQCITVIGRIVSFFLPTKDGEKFAKRYSLKNTWIDSEGMNIDMLLPYPANPENLKAFFESFQDVDFSKELKQEFLYEFQGFTDTPSIDYIIHLIRDYIYFFDRGVMEEELSLLEETMPVYMDFITQVATISENWPTTITVNNIELNTNQVLKTWLASAKHIRYVLMPIQTALEEYRDDIISKDDFIEEMQHLLHKGSATPFPDFGNLLPSLHKELEQNISFLDEKLNDLYSTIAKQLAILLNTQVLQFQPQTFPHPKTSEYLVLNLEKKEFIDNTPMQKKVRLKINEPKESEEIKELLEFTSQKVQQTPHRCTPNRRSRINSEVEGSEHQKQPMDLSPQKYTSNRFSPQMPRKIKSMIEPKSSESVRRKLDFTPEKVIAKADDDYTNAINLLKKYEKGKSIIDSMVRLKEGEQSWNPYWINSELKLKGIIAAVLTLDEEGDTDLESLIQNENSNL